MLKKENSGFFDASSNNWARVCDSCHSAACTVYCRADSAYLCASCDARIHAASLVASRHERVWVCEACERAPAAFLCKADAASLCASCDADIHSANPLARRHHRVPIMPIPGTLYGPPAVDTVGGGSMMIGGTTGEGTEDDGFLSLNQDADDTAIDEEDEDEAASWLLLNPPKLAFEPLWYNPLPKIPCSFPKASFPNQQRCLDPSSLSLLQHSLDAQWL